MKRFSQNRPNFQKKIRWIFFRLLGLDWLSCVTCTRLYSTMNEATPAAPKNSKKRLFPASDDSCGSNSSAEIGGLAQIGAGLLSTMGAGHSESELKKIACTEDFFERMHKDFAEVETPDADEKNAEKSPVKIAKALDSRQPRVCEIVPVRGYGGAVIALLFRSMYDLLALIKRIPTEKIIHIGRQALHKSCSQPLVAAYLSHAKPIDGVDCNFTKFLPDDSVCNKAWVLSVPLLCLSKGPFWKLMEQYGRTFANALNVATPLNPKLSNEEARALPKYEAVFHQFAFNCKFRDPVDLTRDEFIAIANGVKAQEAFQAKNKSAVLSEAVSPLVAAARKVEEGEVLNPIIF